MDSWGIEEREQVYREACKLIVIQDRPMTGEDQSDEEFCGWDLDETPV